MPENRCALLRDVADLVAQVVLGHLADIHAVDQDRAVGDVVEARDQVDDGGLARAGRADEGRGLARLGGKADVVQRIFFRAGIAEGDVAELDRAPERRREVPAASAGSLMCGSVSSTSAMRSPETEARGRMMNMIDSIRKEKTICMAYCMKAIMSPTCMVDAATWCAPTQMIASDQAVHDQHHQRHHDHHDPVDEQAGTGQVLVGLVEAVLLERPAC